MKKIYVSAMLLIISGISATAQFNYSPTNSTTLLGTYSDLGTSGSAITTADFDNSNSAATPIGFTFTYNGTAYTDFILNTNGFIKLGTSAPSSASLFGVNSQDVTGSALLSTNPLDVDIISIFNHDLDAGVGGTPEYRVLTSGTAGSRICTIQYENVKDKTSTPVAILENLMAFQIKLYEGSNNIEFVFNSFTASANANPGFKSFGTGIKGSSNSAGNIVFVRKGSTTAWSGSTFGNTGVTTQIFNIRNNVQPEAGRTFRFTAALPNDARVAAFYTLGKIPIPNATPLTDSCSVSNIGLNALSNVTVTLTISGANSFTDTKTIASLAPGASANVVFASYTPTVEGNNTYTVSISNDDNNANNSQSFTQVVNKNTWSYAYGTTAAGGVGFNGGTGDFVAKFNTNIATAISQISVNFSAGGQPYQLGIWDASGPGGIPGTNLWTSATQTSATGVNVLPVSPAVNIPAGNFYVGVKQTGTVNVSFSYQTETPIRSGTFYFVSPGGGTAWADFAPNNSFRFMIEPKLILPVDASVTSISTPATSCLGNNETVSVVLSNPGSNTINPGTASVTLQVRGANIFTGTLNNTTAIASGGSETINFTGINLSNPGTNLDTAFVVIAGDGEIGNDKATSSHTTTTTINSFPAVENVETTLPVFSWVTALNGAAAWFIQTGNYTNGDQTQPLPPHGGTKFLLFDSYNAPAGTTTRLFSNCLSIPASGGTNCGYNLNFWMSHDNTTNLDFADSLYVSVSTNKGLTWTRLSPGYQRHDASLTLDAAPIWRNETISLAAYAGQTIQIGFEGVSKFGNAFGLDDITIGSTAAGNTVLSSAANNGINLVKNCDDQGWTYYNDPANANQMLFAVQWDPGNTGANANAKLNAIPRIQLDPSFFAAEDIPNKLATYTMRRYWDVNLNGSTLTAPVNVRFFYDPAEKAAIDNAASTFATANAGVLESGLWFKTNTGAFVPNATNVIPDGVIGASSLVNVNNAVGNTINGVLYAQFNGLSSFSGGTYATGVGINTPIPVKVEYFRGTKQASSHVLDWKVSCTNTQYAKMTIELSTDGRIFSGIYSIKETAVRCQQPFSFANVNPVAGINYYRLRMEDDHGVVSYSSIVALMNGIKGFELVNIAPNPVTEGRFKLNITSAEQKKMEVIVADLTGRIIIKQAVNIIPGFNALDMNVSKLSAGNYQLFGITADGKTRVLQFVKQ